MILLMFNPEDRSALQYFFFLPGIITLSYNIMFSRTIDLGLSYKCRGHIEISWDDVALRGGLLQVSSGR